MSNPSFVAPIWPRTVPQAILFWVGCWTVLIGGTGAVMVASKVSDAALRADLARHGVVTTATIAGHGTPIYDAKGGCGKGMWAVVRFTPDGEKARTRCVYIDDLPGQWSAYALSSPPNPTSVELVYDPSLVSHFVVAPGGVVPQRNVDGIWGQWAKRTLVLLGIFLPVVAFVVWRRRRVRSVEA